jgi:hypothetical protein
MLMLLQQASGVARHRAVVPSSGWHVWLSLQLLVPFLEEPRIELLALAAGPAPRELRVSAPQPRPRS